MKILTSDEQLENLARDSGFLVRRPIRGYLVSSEGDVGEVIAEASARGLSVTARGAGTSISSQAVGSGYILQFQGDQVRLEANSVRCDPAVVKAELNKRLDSSGLWVPVDPSSFKSCTLGGMAANNSSGSRSFKYGSTVDYVSEFRAIFPGRGPARVVPLDLETATGTPGPIGAVASLLAEHAKEIAEESPKVSKNSSGYRLERVIHDGLFDLPKLLVGSEGTLAVFSEIRFKTNPKPRSRALTIFEVSLDELDQVASRLRAKKPSAIELVDKSIFAQAGRESMVRPYSRGEDEYLVFSEFDGTEPEVQGKLLEVAGDSKLMQYQPLTLQDSADVSRAWEVRNETLTIAGELRRGSRVPLPGVEDVVVPKERLGSIVKLLTGIFEEKGLQYISYGHAGDANLHMRPLLDPSSEADLRIMNGIMEECFEAVWKMGGSMTGEHGDGRLRAPFVERQYRKTYWLMKEVKRLFDPKGLLNPGVKVT